MGQKLPDMEKKFKNNVQKKNQIRGENGMEWVVEVLSSHVVLLKTLYCAVCSVLPNQIWFLDNPFYKPIALMYFVNPVFESLKPEPNFSLIYYNNTFPPAINVPPPGPAKCRSTFPVTDMQSLYKHIPKISGKH